MKFVGLISGGKDSIFNLVKCVAHGHELVCLANLHPDTQGETDSFMYQTVGVEIAVSIASCLEVPLYRRAIQGSSLDQGLDYSTPSERDEVEDLYQLLAEVKSKHPGIEAVASGAIFSHYQRLRVENVCSRLGLVSLAYLWLRDQSELLNEMVEARMDARLAKVCSMGLKPVHLGKSIAELQSLFERLKGQFGFNVCGEGGEYETVVLDCPLFTRRKVRIVENELVHHEDNDFAPVAYLRFKNLEVVDKTEEEML